MLAVWARSPVSATVRTALAHFGRRRRDTQQGTLLLAVVPRAARGTRSRADEPRKRRSRDRRATLALAGETANHCDAGLRIAFAATSCSNKTPPIPPPPKTPSSPPSPSRDEQGARSFDLRAALRWPSSINRTGRPTDAHDVLAPALEGFSPTPEFPQIAEAQALFEALAADEDGESRRRAPRATAEIADQLWPGRHVGQRLRRRRNESRFRSRCRARDAR